MLNIENLCVEYYRRRQVVPAVRDFSLTMNPGETVGLVGESGSGKSTVALAILRLIRAQEGRITAGKIVFEGRDLLSLPDEDMRRIRGQKIAMIFQDPFTSLNPVMRIREQMTEVLAAHSLDPFSRRKAGEGWDEGKGRALTPALSRLPPGEEGLSEALERVQLDPRRVLTSYPHELSGGQRQRVMIAIALLCRPALVLADEPTTALDVLVQKEILQLLFRLQKEMNMSVLLISHNLALVAQYTHRMVVMKEGRVIEEGDSLQLFKTPRNPYTQALIASLPPMVLRQN